MTNDEILAHKVTDVAKWKSDARAFAVKRWDDDRQHLQRMKDELALQSDDAPMIEKIEGKIAALQKRVDAGADLYYSEFETAKVERHRQEAEAAFAQPGYKNRAERDAEAAEQRRVADETASLKRAEGEAAKKAEFEAAVKAAIEKALAVS